MSLYPSCFAQVFLNYASDHLSFVTTAADAWESHENTGRYPLTKKGA